MSDDSRRPPCEAKDDAEVEERAVEREASCPDCGHDSVGELTWLDRLIARLRGTRARPSCPSWLSSVETGVGIPGQCGCDDPWHS